MSDRWTGTPGTADPRLPQGRRRSTSYIWLIVAVVVAILLIGWALSSRHTVPVVGTAPAGSADTNTTTNAAPPVPKNDAAAPTPAPATAPAPAQ